MGESRYIKYQCTKCNYKFTRREDSPVALRCPYCGDSRIVEDEFNLDKEIREASEF